MRRQLVFRDLFGLGEERARQILPEAVEGPRRPDQKPVFPGHGTRGGTSGPGPRLPGSLPRVWNLPARNPGFTGRDGLLVAVRERLLAGDAAVVQAFQGRAVGLLHIGCCAGAGGYRPNNVLRSPAKQITANCVGEATGWDMASFGRALEQAAAGKALTWPDGDPRVTGAYRCRPRLMAR